MSYIDKVDKRIKDYFKVLESDFPLWLNDYIETKEMLHQQYISLSCGTYYSKLYNHDIFYSSLDHSIGVALIVWHFTHNKKETIAGLFHDIATPTFKHCVDYLNGDSLKQESTEEETTRIIENSKDILRLLKRDNIKVSEIDNYHLYPIADNDSPRMSADRLEYTLSSTYLTYKLLSFEDIDEIYHDIEIQKNEEGIVELGFKNKKIARKFVKASCELSIIFRDDKTRYSLQFIADILKKIIHDKLISVNDLYLLKESEVIDIINKSKYKDAFNYWRNAKKVKVSKEEPKNVYWVNVGAKIRYINPLFNGERMSSACKLAKKMIDKNLSYDMKKYVYLDFKLDLLDN